MKREVEFMGSDDKIHNAAEDAIGHVEEGVGKVTHDSKLEAEGKAKEAKAHLGKAAENVKDAVRD
jgi:uncharacterized protein YjbJ (UPF0337 family)